MLLNKPLVFGKSDSKKFKYARPTSIYVRGAKKANIAEHNSKHLNFNWVKKLFNNEK